MRILKRRENLHTKEIIHIYMRLPSLIVLHLDGCGLSGSGLRTGVKNHPFFEDLINAWPPKNSIQMFLIWYGEVTPWLSIFPQIVWNVVYWNHHNYLPNDGLKQSENVNPFYPKVSMFPKS